MNFIFKFRINLYELIKKNNYQGFTGHLVKRFANSLLKSLQILSKEKIIHCDLKPVSQKQKSIFISFAMYILFRKISYYDKKEVVI